MSLCAFLSFIVVLFMRSEVASLICVFATVLIACLAGRSDGCNFIGRILEQTFRYKLCWNQLYFTSQLMRQTFGFCASCILPITQRKILDLQKDHVFCGCLGRQCPSLHRHHIDTLSSVLMSVWDCICSSVCCQRYLGG